jgi:hypothetical protein
MLKRSLGGTKRTKFSMVVKYDLVRQAYHNLSSVLEDMRNYKEIINRLKNDKEAKKPK